MRSSSLPARLALSVGLAAIPLAAVGQPSGTPSGHVVQNMAEATWSVAPPMLPAGAQIDVLAGDPMTDTLYTLRLKFPAGYEIPAHWHPTDENVTVLSGALYLGMGDKLDSKAGRELNVGGFALMPANANHFAFTKGETIILLHGRGPVEFKYVDPAEDPRNKK